jgi:hypothetical protein
VLETAYPKLSPHIKKQLDAITPSIEPIAGLAYYPCLVTLQDGTSLDRVYLVSQAPWVKLWGIYPGSDPGKSEVLVSDLVSVAESPSRLPALFANELYKAGESGMGYTVFTVVFKTAIPFLRRRKTYLTGGALDFITYPFWTEPKDVIAVLPHVGRRSASLAKQVQPKYYWCLYS